MPFHIILYFLYFIFEKTSKNIFDVCLLNILSYSGSVVYSLPSFNKSRKIFLSVNHLLKFDRKKLRNISIVKRTRKISENSKKNFPPKLEKKN